MADDEAYLQPTFDPNKVTIPRLRSILLQHGLSYPSHVRKAELVRAFEEHVVPQREALLSKSRRAARVKTRPSEVTDMRSDPGVQTISASPGRSKLRTPERPEDANQLTPQPTQSSKSAKSKKNAYAAAKSKDLHYEHQSASSTPKRRSGSSSTEPAIRSAVLAPFHPASHSEEETKPSQPRKSILSSNHAASEPESSNEAQEEEEQGHRKLKGRASVTFNDQVEYWNEEADKSNFSTQNPFQQSSFTDHAVPHQRDTPTRTPKSKKKAKATGSPEKQASESSSKHKSPVKLEQVEPEGEGEEESSYLRYPSPLPDTEPEVDSRDGSEVEESNTSIVQSLRNVLPINLSTPQRWTNRVSSVFSREYDDSGASSSGASSSGSSSARSEGSQGDDVEISDASEDEIDENEVDEGWDGADMDATGTTEDYSFDSSMQAQRASPFRAIRSRTRSKSPNSKGSGAISLIIHFLTRLLATGLVAYALIVLFVRARESRTIGYCDTGSDTNRELAMRSYAPRGHAPSGPTDNLDNLTLSHLVPASWLPHTCTPCPAHGECRRGAFLDCSTVDYLQSPSAWAEHTPAALKVLVPLDWLAPKCVPDTHKLVLALELGGEVERILAQWHGQVKCGYSPAFEGAGGGRLSLSKDRADAGALPASQLRDDLWERMEGDSIDSEYFHQLWDLALSEYSRAGEIQSIPGSEEEGQYGQLIFTPRAIVPFKCQVRLSFRAFIQRHRVLGISLLSILVLGAWLRYTRQVAVKSKVQVRALVQLALDRLAQNAAQHALQPTLHPNPWLSPAQLRDQVLISTHDSVSERKLVWTKVARLVEENSNVRTRQAKSAGDWIKVWEWIGPLPLLQPSATGLGSTLDNAGDRTFLSVPSSPQHGSRRQSFGVGDQSIGDQTGLSAFETSRFLQPLNKSEVGTDTSIDPDRTGASHADEPDRTGVSAIDASRMLQPLEPEMSQVRDHALQGRYF